MDTGTTGAPGPVRSLTLTEPVPGGYEAEFATSGPGALLLSARLALGDRIVAEGQGRLSLPFARELLPDDPGEGALPGSGRALLQALADRTGGGEATVPAAVLDAGPDRTHTRWPLRNLLLVTAVMLFVADVALRRVKFLRSKP